MGSNGLSVVFLNQTTMVFGDKESVKEAMDARDGMVPDFLTNGDWSTRWYCRFEGRHGACLTPRHSDA